MGTTPARARTRTRARCSRWVALILVAGCGPAAAQAPGAARDLDAAERDVEAIAAIAHDLVSRPERCPWLEPHMARLTAARPTLAAELTALCTRPVEIAGDARGQVDGVDLADTGGRAWIGPRRLTLVRGGQRTHHGLCVATDGVTRVDAAVAVEPGATVAERALAHEVSAFAALQAGDRCTAIAELAAAYAEVPAPGYAYNVALAYAEWPGHCTDARRAFEALLDRCESCAEGPRARERLVELATTCSSTVTVTAPAPFTLRHGERALGRSAPDPLRAGHHRAELRVPSGLQLLSVVPDRGREHVLAVALAAGERGELQAALEQLQDEGRSPARTYAAIGSAGVAVVALGASAILGGAYAGAADELEGLAAQGARDAATPLVPRAEALVSDGNAYRVGAYVGLGVGVASAVAAAVLWLWPADAAEPAP